ncbi:MAG: hypothetical protein RSB59_03815 [Clostridia bacterium]
MTIEEVKTIVTAVIASLGGITGIVAIINAVVRIITTTKTTRASKVNTSALGSVKTELLEEIDKRMACSLDVDISATLNPVLEKIEAKYLNTAMAQSEQMYALKNLMVEVAQMMSTSRKLSEDDKLRLLETISKSNDIIVEMAKEEKPKLKVALSAPKEETQKSSNTSHNVVV